MSPPPTDSWLRDRPELLARIVRFNTQLAASIHPGRAAEWVAEPTFRHLLQTPRDQRHLSQALNKWVGLDPDGFYDFQPLPRRFALLDFPVLDRLMVYVGAALIRIRLSRIISRDDLKTIKAGLGEDAFDFAVRRADFMALEDAGDETPDTINAETAARIGWTRLESCLSGESTELTRRLELKLPPHTSLDFARHTSPSVRRQAVRIMQKILITEIQPEVAPCFA